MEGWTHGQERLLRTPSDKPRITQAHLLQKIKNKEPQIKITDSYITKNGVKGKVCNVWTLEKFEVAITF